MLTRRQARLLGLTGGTNDDASHFSSELSTPQQEQQQEQQRRSSAASRFLVVDSPNAAPNSWCFAGELSTAHATSRRRSISAVLADSVQRSISHWAAMNTTSLATLNTPKRATVAVLENTEVSPRRVPTAFDPRERQARLPPAPLRASWKTVLRECCTTASSTSHALQIGALAAKGNASPNRHILQLHRSGRGSEPRPSCEESSCSRREPALSLQSMPQTKSQFLQLSGWGLTTSEQQRKRAMLQYFQTRINGDIQHQSFAKVYELRLQALLESSATPASRSSVVASNSITAASDADICGISASPFPLLCKAVDEDEELHSGSTSSDGYCANGSSAMESGDADTEQLATILSLVTAIDLALKRQCISAYMTSSSASLQTSPAAVHDISLSADAALRGALHCSANRLAALETLIGEAMQRVESSQRLRLLQYQKEGVRWLLRLNVLEGMNGMLADDMGLGKTAQTVSYLSCYRELVELVMEPQLQQLLRLRRATSNGSSASVAAASTTGPGGGGSSNFSSSNPRLLLTHKDSGCASEYGLPSWLISYMDAMRSPISPTRKGARSFSAHADVERSMAIEAAKDLKRYLWRLGSANHCTLDDMLYFSAPSATAKLPSGQDETLVRQPRKRGRSPSVTLTDHGAAVPLPGVSSYLNHHLEVSLRRFLPILIIAPLSTMPHWHDEFQRFGQRHRGDAAVDVGESNSRFSLFVLNRSRPEREEQMRRFLAACHRHYGTGADHATHLRQESEEEIEVGEGAAANGTKRRRRRGEKDQIAETDLATPTLIIPHDMLARPLFGPMREIARICWHVIVIDEAQRMKSSESILFNKACRLHAISRLALTGTPLQNNTTEIFSLLRFIAPSSFSSAGTDLFGSLDTALLALGSPTAAQNPGLHLQLCRRVHDILSPFILRREKSVLQTSLPPIKDFAVVCPLLPYQVAQLSDIAERHRRGTLSGNVHIQRRKVLLHPYTLLPYFYVDEGVVSRSGKMLVLDFMMRFLLQTGHKFLLFCGWTLVLDVVETLCSLRQITYARLDGKTPAEKRERDIQHFNHGHRDPSAAPTACFLISKVAGGVGLNLQAADTVFLLDIDYNPQRDAQALSRVYRVGQQKEVRVYRLVVDHPVERHMIRIHGAKESLNQAVVQAGRFDLHSSAAERDAALQQLVGAAPCSDLAQLWTTPQLDTLPLLQQTEGEASDTRPAVEAPQQVITAPAPSPSSYLTEQSQMNATTADTRSRFLSSLSCKTSQLQGERPHRGHQASYAVGVEVKRGEPELEADSSVMEPPLVDEDATATAAEQASALLALQDRFREVLPRSEEEARVLELMLANLTRETKQ